MRNLVLLAVMLAVAVSTSAHSADWNGPGWYEVLYTSTSGYMIWHDSPFRDEAACNTYVKDRFNDKTYAESMRQKYGPIGDHNNGFEIVCVEMQTKADAPPDD